MSARFIRSCFVISRVIQLAGGATSTLLPLSFCVYFFAQDFSGPTPPEPLSRDSVFAFLMLVGPALLGATGSYLQVIRGKPWAFALVAIGGLGNFVFVGVSVGFLFAYTGNSWGQGAVLGDLLAVSLTVVAAFVNLVLSASRTALQAERRVGSG